MDHVHRHPPRRNSARFRNPPVIVSRRLIGPTLIIGRHGRHYWPARAYRIKTTFIPWGPN